MKKEGAMPKIEGIEGHELRNLYDNAVMTQQEIGDYYGVSRETIRQRMKEYDIETRSISKVKKKDFGITQKDMGHMYNVKEMSQRAIAYHYGVSLGTIQNRMKEFGMQPRSNSEALIGNINACNNRIYSINEDFFKTWTPGSAWMYGWAIGDGNFTNQYKLQFRLGRIDKEVLFKFRDIINSEHEVTDYEVWNKKYQKWLYGSSIIFLSTEIVKDLNQLTYKDVPYRHFPHFLRGFFEAEGSIFWRKNKKIRIGGTISSSITQNDRSILKYIHTTLQETGIVNGGSISKNGNGWQLVFSVNDSLGLYDYMYDSTCGNMYLQRKKDKFEELMRKYDGVSVE